MKVGMLCVDAFQLIMDAKSDYSVCPFCKAFVSTACFLFAHIILRNSGDSVYLIYVE